MRIDGWRVDGFGCLKDYEVGDLGPGVTVVFGENEAGKSTLLGFLRAILFGFPDRRTNERQYPPLRGGRHGGRLDLRDGHDELWTLERYADARRAIALCAADGREGDENELRRLLGGVDAALFKSVFAFSLTELQDLETLDEEGIRDRIFTSGISGAGKSARDVIRRLDQRAAGMLKQGRGDAEINNLVRDIIEKQREVSEAERLAGGYADLLAQEKAFDDEARGLSEQVGPVRTRIARLQALAEMHPQWLELEGMRAELGGLPDVDGDALPDRIAALVESITQQRTREERVASLETDEAKARAELDRLLARLGSGWDVDRVRAFDDSIVVHDEVKVWAEKLNGASAEADAAGRELATAQGRVAGLEAQKEGIVAELPEVEPRTVEEIGDTEARLSGLWTDVRDLQQQRLVEHAQQPAAPMGRRVGVLAAVLAGVSILAAAVSLATGYSQLAGGLAVAAVMLAVTAVVAFAGAGRAALRKDGVSDGTSPVGPRRSGSPVDELAQRVKATAEGLGLPAEPSSADLQALGTRLNDERTSCGAWDAIAGRLRDADSRLDIERKNTERVAGEAARLRSVVETSGAQWTAWLEAHGLPEMTPGGALEHLGVLAEARAADRALTLAADSLAEIERGADEWDDAAGQALIAAGRSASDLDRQTLRVAIGTLHGELERRKDVVGEIGRLERTLAARFGHGDSVAEAAKELAAGDVATWQGEQRDLEQEVKELDGQREAAIDARARARQQREAIEESADIARLQMERESLKAELAAKVYDYRVVVTARGLIAATLQAFVRDRQPAVLARASESFAQVTGGRYTSVEQDDEGNEAVVVVSSEGHLTPEKLSRGTAEQLYLAIRLALVGEFAARSESLPLIMDDCLVNFDPQRAEQMARLLSSSSGDGQCLLFTCHPETAELMVAQSGGAATVIKMPAVG
jgi:uncharacterized protein YhaN